MKLGRWLKIGVMLMVAATSNHCRIVLGNPVNGVISSQGFHADFPASMWDKLESRAAIAGRHAAVVKENLMYIPQLDCIILRPDISLKQTMEAGDYTTTGGTWGLSEVYGNPTLTLAHQKDVTAEGWKIDSEEVSYFNQGFMVWWKKYATPAAGSPNFKIKFLEDVENDTSTGIILEFISATKLKLTYNNSWVETSEVYEINIPQTFYPTEFPVNILIAMFIRDNIILGFGGMDNIVTIKVSNPMVDENIVTDEEEYSVTTAETIQVTGDGSVLLGFKMLTYATSGGFSTKLYYPGYIMSTVPVIEKKTIEPAGTDIVVSGFMGGGEIDSEEVTASDAEKFGLYFNAQFTGDDDGLITPIYYKASVRHEPSRVSISGTPQELATQIIKLNQSISIGKDGMFNGSNITATIACEEQFYPSIFMMRSPKVQYYLQTIGQESEILRDTHYIDIKEVSRPEHGQFLMDLVSRDVTKELELTPMLESVDYDYLIKRNNWNHAHLMEFLAARAGVTLVHTAADSAADPVMPYVSDADNAMWQFKRNENIWQCMQKIREYSGWMMYPDSQGRIVYKPKPTTSTTEDYTWDVNNMAIEGIRYKLIDLYRTRFLVWGKAAADNTGAYPYKKGDNILGGGYHAELESQLGRSRCLIVLDPGLNDWDSVERMLNALYDYYTADPFFFSGTLTYPEQYPSLWPGQVVKLTDSLMEWDGESISGKKFVITSYNLSLTGGEGEGTVEMEAI